MTNFFMVLVDSNIILDIMTEDPSWCAWAIRTLESQHEPLAINPIIYAEVSIKVTSVEALDEAMQPFKRLPLPYGAAFLAGKAFLNFLKNKGKRTNTLPDFFIGAHAAILEIPLVTREIKRYKRYFPSLSLIHP